MQFIKNGPDVPEGLLQLHEEGRVILFCGAGVSYPAGLKGFGDLVEALYERLGITPNAVQKAAMKNGQYDTAIGLLEDAHAGRRMAVRQAIADILTPKSYSPKYTRTHEALLTLSQRRDGKTRLITTNFDRLFEAVIKRRKRKKLRIDIYKAPLLPVPKNRWNGLVYLHGLLPADSIDSELDCLVVSSGDFGLAYLTERWAARFVSELLRHYTLCFVGYSLNDPVLRYMMDARAADRQRGDASLDMYAFGSYTVDKAATAAEWRAKNVIPILYQETEDHRYLHETLRSWAEIYRDGARGKEMIIVKEASANPMATTVEDDFVSRVLWALSDEGGLPAKRFADLNPVPPLKWLLEPLSEARYNHSDLSRFGVPPKADPDDKITFSLTHRPAPYPLAPWMALVTGNTADSQWDNVMRHLARWLTRYLDDPALVLWLAKRGGRLHDRFTRLVDQHLEKIIKFEREGNFVELNRIRSESPRAIPRPLLRTVWRLLLSGRIKSGRQDFDLYDWVARFQRDGWSPSLRLSLRELMTPCIELREPFHWKEGADEEQEPESLKEIVDWGLKLRAGHVRAALRDLSRSPRWQNALPTLLPDFNLLLRDALDLKRELGSANAQSDHSYVRYPSITESDQNRAAQDWTVLIEITRDAWLALARHSVEQARLVAQQWQQIPYPLFKRLAFFAAAQESVIPPALALDWLLAEDFWWLWTLETQRETFRLLVALASRVEPADLRRLEQAVLAGPPRLMFKDDADPERLKQIMDHEVWLRLTKMASAGAPLGEEAQVASTTLLANNPELQLAPDDRDEFPVWMGSGEEGRRFIATPRRHRELIDWLKRHPESNPWHEEDDWRQRCRDEFATTAYTLYALSSEDVWPSGRWREALQAWAEESLLQRSWHYIAPLLAQAPAELVEALASSLSWWLRALSKSFEGHDDLFLVLCLKVLNIEYQSELDSSDPVSQAINHPVGQVTEALLNWWYRRELKDNQGLPEELTTTFTRLCAPLLPVYRHARVLMATHVISLFRVDPDWTKQHLLPHFDWSVSTEEAQASWEGFLWSPRIYPPLLELIKPSFLDTARHYSELGDYGRQYAALLTFIALEPEETAFTKEELRTATMMLPRAGRKEALQALTRALEGSGDQRAEYWHNRIYPYWKSIWPQSRDFSATDLAEPVALLCIAAGEAFPEAVKELHPWLQAIEHPDFIIHQLEEGRLVVRNPEAGMEFLSAVIDDRAQWPPRELKNLLDRLVAAKPDFSQDIRFQKLTELLLRHE